MSLYSRSGFEQLYPVSWQEDDRQLQEEILYDDAEYIPSEDDEMAYAQWAEIQELAEDIAFSQWLDTASGLQWITMEAERHQLQYGRFRCY